MKFRIGHGYDMHRLVPDRQLWLGGVLIPHDRGLEGHSDADVLIHAICDAMLGAIAGGDIGQLFPDTDNEYENIDSKILLKKVSKLLDSKGWQLVNIDATLIMEAPRVASYIGEIRSILAGILKADIADVSVKATTTEGLGPEGRGEGISAHAVVLVSKL